MCIFYKMCNWYSNGKRRCSEWFLYVSCLNVCGPSEYEWKKRPKRTCRWRSDSVIRILLMNDPGPNILSCWNMFCSYIIRIKRIKRIKIHRQHLQYPNWYSYVLMLFSCDPGDASRDFFLAMYEATSQTPCPKLPLFRWNQEVFNDTWRFSTGIPPKKWP